MIPSYNDGIWTEVVRGGPGAVDIRLKGYLYVRGDGEWTFSGAVSALPNDFDFDPQRRFKEILRPLPGQRGPGGEFTTHVGKWLTDIGLGQSYTVTLDGSRRVEEKGCCGRG